MSEVTTEQGLSVQDQFAILEKKAQDYANKALAIKVTDSSQKDLMESAKETKIEMKATLKEVTTLHKDLKEESLRTGQFLDSIKRKLVAIIEPAIKHLQEQEDFDLIQEQLRKDALKTERRKIMAELIGQQQADLMQLGEMDQQVFDNMVAGYKASAEQRIKDEEARQAFLVESERKRKEEEEANRVEIERLRKENEANEAKLKEEREARFKIEQEAERKRQEEQAAIEQQKKNERKMKRAPDRVKLLALAEQIQLLPLPEGLKDDQAKAILSHTQNLLTKVVKYVTDNANLL